jgi:hypothetical protein
MPNTFELIASSTVGSGGAANIDFTSIPSTYTDLVLKTSIRGNRSNSVDSLAIYFNNDTTAGRFPARMLYGTGASALSYTTNTNYNDEYAYVSGNNSTASTFGNTEFYIPNYAGSTQKSVSIDSVGENNATTAYMSLTAFLYNQTTAISRITLVTYTGALIREFSTAYLYGVKNA